MNKTVLYEINFINSKIILTKMLSNEVEKDRAKIKTEIFDPIVTKYNESKRTGDFSAFQKKIEDGAEVFMVSILHYEGNVLCGIVSHGTPKIERYLRECDPETFNVKELVPSEGNVFEEYSFFAISIQKMQMAYLSDPAVSANIHGLVLTLFKPSVNINYFLEESSLYDHDIKKKIKQLGNKVAVYGLLRGQEERIIGGDPSFKNLEKRLGGKFKVDLKKKAKLGKQLSDEDIDVILETAAKEEFSSFTFTDERDSDKEVIDVIRNHVRFSKNIELSTEEQKIPAAIWRKLSGTLG